MVRAIGLAPNTYPVPEALPRTTPSLSRWSCSYLDRVGVTVTVTVTIRVRVRVRVRLNARVRARVRLELLVRDVRHRHAEHLGEALLLT